MSKSTCATLSEKHAELVEEVKQRPLLYGENYHNNEAKQEMWKEISEKIDVSAPECKEIWFKLRNRLGSAMKRRLHNHDADSRCWQQNMAFLIPHMQLTGVCSDEALNRVAKRIKKSPQSAPESDEESVYEYSHESRDLEEVTLPPQSEEPEDEAGEGDENPEPDHVDLFCLSVALAAKRLPSSQKIGLKMKVCELVSKAQLRHLNLN